MASGDENGDELKVPQPYLYQKIYKTLIITLNISFVFCFIPGDVLDPFLHILHWTLHINALESC